MKLRELMWAILSGCCVLLCVAWSPFESNLIQQVKDFKLPNGSTMEEWLTKHPALTKVEWKIDPTGDLKVVHFIGVVNLGKIYKVLHPWTFDKQVSEDEAAYNARKDLASCGIKTLMVMVQFKRRYPDNPNSEFAQHFSFVAVGVNERVVVKEDAIVQGLLSKFLDRDLTSFCRFDLLDFGPFRGYASKAAYQQAMAPFEEEDKRREAAKRANWSTLDDFIRASDIPTLAKFMRQVANAADRAYKSESIFHLNLLCDPVKIRISDKEVDDLRKIARPLVLLDDIQLSQFATRLKNQVLQEKGQAAKADVPDVPTKPTSEEGGASADKYMQDGVVYFQQQKYDEAIVSYEKAIKAEPRAADAYNMMGMAYRFKYNQLRVPEFRQKEMAAFQKAMEIDPKNWVAMINLATDYYADGQKGKAAALFKKALELKPDHPEKAEIEKMIAAGEPKP